MSRRMARVVAATLAALTVPGGAAAHPLGNFTINHYAGIVVAPDAIRLDVVIDRAEIPAFEERRRLDVDGDGEISDAEVDAALGPACATLARSLVLLVDGRRADLAAVAGAMSFPMGAGLPTMRLECGYSSPRSSGNATAVEFEDLSFPGQQGWREIVVVGDRMTIDGAPGTFLTESPSARLTSYPADRLTEPLDMAAVAFTARPGGPPLADRSSPPTSSESPPAALPEISGATDLSPPVVLLALLGAAAVGAGHALTPGHGKTLVAASVLGARATARQAAILGLSITIAHTIGVVGLAVVVLVAQSWLAPGLVAGALPVGAAVGIAVVGAWMLAGELERLRGRRERRGVHHHGSPGASAANGPPGAVSRRGLFAIGLAGGLVPSTSALLILLGSIAAGRPAFGLVLVAAFGIGMAVVLVAVGLAVVAARGWVGPLAARSPLATVVGYVPLAAAVVVLSIGAVLTARALLRLP